MNLRPRLNAAQLATIVGVLLGVGYGLLLHKFRIGTGLRRWSYDLEVVALGERKIDEAAMVYMDEVSHTQLGQPFTSAWDRTLHAKLVDRLTAAGARAIVFDVVFSDPNPNNPAADQVFADALKKSGRVILAADTVRTGDGEKQAQPPFDLLRTNAVDFGSDEMGPDSDLVIREHTPRADNPVSSLAWITAAFLGAPVAKQESNETVERWMNYYGPPNYISWCSYYQALDPDAVPDNFFRGKVVFVGARTQTKFAGERKDEYASPFSFWLSRSMRGDRGALYSSGVEVQATTFLNLLHGDWLRRPTHGPQTIIFVLGGILFGAGLVRFHPAWAAIAGLLGVLLVAASAYFLATKLIWFPWLILIGQIGVCLGWSLLFNSVQLYVEKRLYEQTLRLYLPPSLVKKFSGSPELLKPGATKQSLTLVFTDIADFTTLSEGMDPDELADLMNQYFEKAISKCIHFREGTVAKYIGDAIFCFWNAPEPQENHALLACQAALLLRDETAQPINGRTLRTRIGLHTGVANVGNFGSLQRVDYTALGDSVNMASRLEGLNKHLGTQCLISGTTKQSIGEGLVTRALGSFQLKGFEGLVDVYELVSTPDRAEESRAWRQPFAEALQNYKNRNLEFAAMGFNRVLQLKPGDGPSQFYLKRISELASETLPEDWSAHTMIKEK